MRILFLDDMQTRHDSFQRNHIGHEVTHVYTAAEANAALDQARHDIVFLDHDLAEEHYLQVSQGESEELLPGALQYSPGTGMDVVDYLIAMSVEKRPRHVVVHSYNVRGDEMAVRLRDADIPVTRVRYDHRTRYVK